GRPQRPASESLAICVGSAGGRIHRATTGRNGPENRSAGDTVAVCVLDNDHDGVSQLEPGDSELSVGDGILDHGGRGTRAGGVGEDQRRSIESRGVGLGALGTGGVAQHSLDRSLSISAGVDSCRADGTTTMRTPAYGETGDGIAELVGDFHDERSGQRGADLAGLLIASYCGEGCGGACGGGGGNGFVNWIAGVVLDFNLHFLSSDCVAK